MWELKISKQFRKDLKRYQNKPKQIAHLETENTIKLIWLGSHSELFK